MVMAVSREFESNASLGFDGLFYVPLLFLLGHLLRNRKQCTQATLTRFISLSAMAVFCMTLVFMLVIRLYEERFLSSIAPIDKPFSLVGIYVGTSACLGLGYIILGFVKPR